MEFFGLVKFFGLAEFAGVVARGRDGNTRGGGWVTRGRATLRRGRRRLVRFAAGLVRKPRRVFDPGSLGASRDGCQYITGH